MSFPSPVDSRRRNGNPEYPFPMHTSLYRILHELLQDYQQTTNQPILSTLLLTTCLCLLVLDLLHLVPLDILQLTTWVLKLSAISEIVTLSLLLNVD